MLAGYYDEGMCEQAAVFDLFYRTNPFNGSYAVFAGLEPALNYLRNLRFSGEEIAYLEGLGDRRERTHRSRDHGNTGTSGDFLRGCFIPQLPDGIGRRPDENQPFTVDTLHECA